MDKVDSKSTISTISDDTQSSGNGEWEYVGPLNRKRRRVSELADNPAKVRTVCGSGGAKVVLQGISVGVQTDDYRGHVTEDHVESREDASSGGGLWGVLGAVLGWFSMFLMEKQHIDVDDGSIVGSFPVEGNMKLV